MLLPPPNTEVGSRQIGFVGRQVLVVLVFCEASSPTQYRDPFTVKDPTVPDCTLSTCQEKPRTKLATKINQPPLQGHPYRTAPLHLELFKSQERQESQTKGRYEQGPRASHQRNTRPNRGGSGKKVCERLRRMFFSVRNWRVGCSRGLLPCLL